MIKVFEDFKIKDKIECLFNSIKELYEDCDGINSIKCYPKCEYHHNSVINFDFFNLEVLDTLSFDYIKPMDSDVKFQIEFVKFFNLIDFTKDFFNFEIDFEEYVTAFIPVSTNLKNRLLNILNLVDADIILRVYDGIFFYLEFRNIVY